MKLPAKFLRVIAVVSSVVLAGAYVMYRSTGAERQTSTAPSTQPDKALLPSSKLGAVYTHKYPTTANASGYKLNSSVGPDFAIAADVKAGTIGSGRLVNELFGRTPASQPATVPTTESRVLMPGSKSGDINARNVLYGDKPTHPTTKPTTRPATSRVLMPGSKSDRIHTDPED